MKLLEIKNGQGLFFDANGKFATVDKLTKEDILRLVNLTLGKEDVDFDEYKDEDLKNRAHQIIYKSLYEKLKGLRGRRQEFIDESERQYLQDYEKYRNELSQQGS